MKKLETIITSEKINKEITTSESAGTSQNIVEQTTDNKVSSTELANIQNNTETSLLMKKSTTTTSKTHTRCKKHSD